MTQPFACRPARPALWGGLAVAFGLVLTAGAWAQADPKQQALENSIKWQNGPLTANLGTVAQIEVPAGYQFVAQADMPKLAELTRNLHNLHDVGALMAPEGQWFIFFRFEDVGYVKDDEKDKLDADALLKAFKEGNEEGNKERQSRGWPTLTITGWEQAPFFDPDTKNLTWAIRGQVQGEPIVNYNSRLLGRSGVMSANLVVDPNRLAQVVPTYKQLLAKFSYKPGQRYAEYRQGDKLAQYGLTGLIVGGAAAVAAKTGLLAKFGKAIIVGLVALVGAIGGLFRRIFGRRAKSAA